MTKEKLHEISRRANINHKYTSDNEVIIYEDHRTIINVLYFLKNKRDLNESVDLIMLDNHDDFCNPRKDTIEKIIQFLDSPNPRNLNEIVEFDLNHLDDDWVKAGMELGLINNVFLFNSDESTINFREEYITQNFGTKYFYNLENVWSALGHRGVLNDLIKKEYKVLWDDFGWELNNGKFDFKKDRRKFIFDIDLDCFTTRILDKTIAIPEEIIIEKLTEQSRKSYHYYYSSQQFIKQLIRDAEMVTICYENGCCGGIRESQKIFNLVDHLLFDNEIGS